MYQHINGTDHSSKRWSIYWFLHTNYLLSKNLDISLSAITGNGVAHKMLYISGSIQYIICQGKRGSWFYPRTILPHEKSWKLIYFLLYRNSMMKFISNRWRRWCTWMVRSQQQEVVGGGEAEGDQGPEEEGDFWRHPQEEELPHPGKECSCKRIPIAYVLGSLSGLWKCITGTYHSIPTI